VGEGPSRGDGLRAGSPPPERIARWVGGSRRLHWVPTRRPSRLLLTLAPGRGLSRDAMDRGVEPRGQDSRSERRWPTASMMSARPRTWYERDPDVIAFDRRPWGLSSGQRSAASGEDCAPARALVGVVTIAAGCSSPWNLAAPGPARSARRRDQHSLEHTRFGEGLSVGELRSTRGWHATRSLGPRSLTR